MADAECTPKISLVQLAWAAGFLEGEGSFNCNHGSAVVQASQVQREPLDRLRTLFGGSIWSKKPVGVGKQDIWVWYLTTSRSAQVMMTLYAFMSPRRKTQIEQALAKWKVSRRLKRALSGICRDGHLLEGHNAIKVGKYIRCRICREAQRKRWRAQRRALGIPDGDPERKRAYFREYNRTKRKSRV